MRDLRRDVAGTAQYYSSCARENMAQAVERGSEIAGAPGAAEQENLTRQRPESLERSGRTVNL